MRWAKPRRMRRSRSENAGRGWTGVWERSCASGKADRLEDDLERLHVGEEEELPLHRLVALHHELGLDAEHEVALVPEVGVGGGEHRAAQVDHERGHRRQE